jgi:pimeloyl-ACP methyl ester carboxylesterase
MGGMIAQEAVLRAPARVRSLASISSAPSPSHLLADPELTAILDRPPPADRESAIDLQVQIQRICGAADLPEARLSASAAAEYDRGYFPEGVGRQRDAMLKDRDRRDLLSSVAAPTIVVHGRRDRIIDYRGAVDTALPIRDAELHLYADMGHEIPLDLVDEVVRSVRRNADRSRRP